MIRSLKCGILQLLMRRFRYLDTLTIAFVVVLLVSNLVGPKICQIGPLKVAARNFFSPSATSVAMFSPRCTATLLHAAPSGWDFSPWDFCR
jgi:hypothetical protein